MSNRFGKRLYQHFFKSYTEKVWGVPTTELRADWAAQRIKGLSFFSAAKAAFFGNKGNKIKSLIDEFQYPRYGPGQMWEMMTERIAEMGGEVRLEEPVTKIEVDDGERRAPSTRPARSSSPRDVISSLPLRAHGRHRRPAARRRGPRGGPGPALPRLPDGRADPRRRGPLPRQLDLHPRAGRPRRPHPELPLLVARGWSRTRTRPASAWSTSASRATTSGRWPTRTSSRWPRASSSSSASRGPSRSGAATSCACRWPTRSTTRSTPSAWRRSARWLDPLGTNLVQVGRNGLHRYNNQDHSMLTAMRAVDNILAGTAHDIWAVNVESAYHEKQTDADHEQPYREVPETEYVSEPLAERAA